VSATFTTRRNRQTGTHITVGTAIEMALDPAEGDCAWYTICEEHNEVCGHRTRKLAEFFAASPLDWCEDCRTAHLD
jgi:hypothetical protein